MRFLEFTALGKDDTTAPISVRLDRIILVSGRSDGTDIQYSETAMLRVSEDYEQVIRMINDAIWAETA